MDAGDSLAMLNVYERAGTPFLAPRSAVKISLPLSTSGTTRPHMKPLRRQEARLSQCWVPYGCCLLHRFMGLSYGLACAAVLQLWEASGICAHVHARIPHSQTIRAGSLRVQTWRGHAHVAPFEKAQPSLEVVVMPLIDSLTPKFGCS